MAIPFDASRRNFLKNDFPKAVATTAIASNVFLSGVLPLVGSMVLSGCKSRSQKLAEEEIVPPSQNRSPASERYITRAEREFGDGYTVLDKETGKHVGPVRMQYSGQSIILNGLQVSLYGSRQVVKDNRIVDAIFSFVIESSKKSSKVFVADTVGLDQLDTVVLGVHEIKHGSRQAVGVDGGNYEIILHNPKDYGFNPSMSAVVELRKTD